MRDIKVFMLSNPANVYTNPYFAYFNLSMPYNTDIKTFKDGLILLQYMRNEEYRIAKKQTKFGRLVAGTTFSDYAIDNKPLNINKNFIMRKTGTAKFSFAFKYNNNTFGVWYDYTEGKIFVSNDYIKNTPFMFACTLKDHTPNTMLINSLAKVNFWKSFIDNFKLGNVYYENNKIKYVCEEMIRLVLTLK